jgi:transcriptional regulator with XRE-family HTH domain
VETFFQRLEYAIRRSGYPKGAVAKHLGVPQSSVSRWLGGSYPKAETVGTLAKFLGVDVNWLMSGDPDKELAEPVIPIEQQCVVRDDEVPYVFTRRDRGAAADPPPELPILERLRTLEASQLAMQATIERLAKLIEGKEPR